MDISLAFILIVEVSLALAVTALLLTRLLLPGEDRDEPEPTSPLERHDPTRRDNVPA